MTKLNTKNKVTFIEQAQQTECGLCCIAMIVDYFKGYISFNEMYEYVGTGRDGLSLLQMKNLAQMKNLDVSCYKISNIENLSMLEYPFIAYWKKKHYIIVEKLEEKRITIVDPAIGRRKIEKSEFEKNFSGFIMTCQPNSQFTFEKKPNIWMPYLELLKVNKNLFLKLIMITFFLQLFMLTTPIIIQYLVDNINKINESVLLNLAPILILIISLYFIFNIIKAKLMIKLINSLDHNMMDKFFKHLLNLPYHFFLLRKFGDLLFRLNSLRTIRDLISSTILNGLLNVVLLSLCFFYMIYQSPILTSVMLAFIFINSLLVILSRNKLKETNQEYILNKTDVESLQTEILYGITTVKTTGIEEKVLNNWEHSFVNTQHSYKENFLLQNYINISSNTLSFAGTFTLLGVGAYLVYINSISIGVLMAFISISNTFFSLSETIIQMFNTFITTGTYLRRISDVLDSPTEKKGEDLITVKNIDAIRVENIDFSYSRQSKMILKNINLKISSNQKIAIIGKTGSGKSTLARLILGLHEPTNGNVFINNINTKIIDNSKLRQSIGVVTQDVTLFNKSIFENIAIYNENITLEKVIEAAKIARIHEDIINMPMQYNTIISEMGFNLSGGQRQRIALARALVHNPQLLLLDEATSALDHVTERSIDNYLNSINCTRIIIAHRLTTVTNADLIIVMDKGEIVNTGTHKELLTNSDYYASFFKNKEFSETTII